MGTNNACRRSRGKRNLFLIHLNLCISLALGLLVFLVGIETATNNEVQNTGVDPVEVHRKQVPFKTKRSKYSNRAVTLIKQSW